MTMVNSAPTSMVASSKLSANDSSHFEDPKLFRSIAGTLQYLTLTRPDLTFAVSKICQYMHNPTVNHWKALKRILRYIKGNMDQDLLFTACTDFRLFAFSDADWGADADDRKSVIRYCVNLGTNLIAWKSNKQRVVSRSSTEAEFRAIAAAQSKVIWTQNLLHELHLSLTTILTLYCDNQSACLLTVNPILHSKFKYFELDLHFVRDQVTHKKLFVTNIPFS
ncbi:secreted RxLR effector protein 161-like [Arachis duranensis]|uniref:Secreted RxLR effector protein 161-like n=1 Tax=Arachis duranensis TaxID=130453 RepID=A0A9C6WKL7_ARADU|nr:secreted RxLR effector protein 161-like [Arachis duranensis]